MAKWDERRDALERLARAAVDFVRDTERPAPSVALPDYYFEIIVEAEQALMRDGYPIPGCERARDVLNAAKLWKLPENSHPRLQHAHARLKKATGAAPPQDEEAPMEGERRRRVRNANDNPDGGKASDDLVAEMEGKHVTTAGIACTRCGELWPCPTAQLVARVREGSDVERITFDSFQETNRRRCEEVWHSVEDWPPEMWALAIAGEAGELANLAKKVVRGDFTLEEARQDMLGEVADVMTYCDLLMTRLGANTYDEVWRKFDEVSARTGWVVPLTAEGDDDE